MDRDIVLYCTCYREATAVKVARALADKGIRSTVQDPDSQRDVIHRTGRKNLLHEPQRFLAGRERKKAGARVG